MNILICGAGIAGLTLAFWLRRQHHPITILEKSPALRDAGYMIDFIGSGYEVAERMGIIDDLAEIYYPISKLVFLDPNGRANYSILYPQFRRLFDNRHFNFMRGELEQVLWSKLADEVNIRFDTTVKWLQYEGDRVSVETTDGQTEKFDLVVGADGLHSRVRELAFGHEEKFKRFLGYYTAAFIIDRPAKDFDLDDAFYTMTAPNQQVGVYPIRGNKVATFFLYRADRLLDDVSPATGRSELRRVFGDQKWIVPELLQESETAKIYFDEVSQIEMPGWSHHHVVLVGDAAQCVSLAAGQGASLAMAGAYMLSAELEKSEENIKGALLQYEARLKPEILKKQKAGRRTLKWFAPPTEFRIAVRDFVMRMSGSQLGQLFLKRFLDTGSVIR